MLQQGEQVLELFESDVVRGDVQPFQGVSSQADCAVVDDRLEYATCCILGYLLVQGGKTLKR